MGCHNFCKIVLLFPEYNKIYFNKMKYSLIAICRAYSDCILTIKTANQFDGFDHNLLDKLLLKTHNDNLVTLFSITTDHYSEAVIIILLSELSLKYSVVIFGSSLHCCIRIIFRCADLWTINKILQ